MATLRPTSHSPPDLHMNRRRFLLATTAFLGGTVIGGKYWQERWRYLVIHHSAGSYGDIQFLQRVHRERQPDDLIDAIPYHYIIGNGNGLGMGEVASDWRQSYNIWGTHVSANNLDHNFRGLGICLIGNFENIPPQFEQYDALVKLVKILMKRYGIPVGNVIGHGMLHGETTKCPGKYFPMEQLIKDIA